MGEVIREICLMSILCSAAHNLAPDGAVKNFMRICCTVVLMLTVLGPLGEFDLNNYVDITARYRELELNMSRNIHEIESRLDRLVIEEEYETYIMDKAEDLAVELELAELELEWTEKGFWVPRGVQLYTQADAEHKEVFSSFLLRELGISEDRIIWKNPE